MAAGLLNILIEQGTTFSRTITINATESTLLDLTGKTLRGQIRRRLSDAEPAATFTFTIANQTTNTGEAQWSLTAAETAALTADTHRYDIELVDGTTVTRLLEGEAFVSGEVTR